MGILFFIGGPGSGRGTQCELIQTKTGYTHVSTGDVLRHEVMSGSQRGLKFYKLMSEGNAIPDDDIAELVRDVMMAKIIGSKVSLIFRFEVRIIITLPK